jgi:hypothetical protein
MITWKHADINAYVESQARPETRSYGGTTEQGVREVYSPNIPSRDTEEHFSSNKPWVYTIVVASTFLFTSIVFVCLQALWNGGSRLLCRGLRKR